MIAPESFVMLSEENEIIPWYRKQVFLLLLVLLLVFVWRRISCSHAGEWGFDTGTKIQQSLHSLPFPLQVLLQWYTLFFIAVSCFMLWNYMEYHYDVYTYGGGLDPEILNETWHNNTLEFPDITEQHIKDCLIPPWLRVVTLMGPRIGGFVFVLLAVHVVMTVKKLYSGRMNTGHADTPLKPDFRTDMVLVVIAIPAVFLCMSIRSTGRMIFVMRGRDFYPSTVVTDLALYDENFELAAICQYFGVFSFVELCFSFMRDQHASDEIKSMMKKLGFQGVYAWVILGTVHSIIIFVAAYFGHHGMTVEQKTKALAAAEKIGNFASAFSLLATYNMFIVCSTSWMKQGLGNASMKFNGTKMLLILGPNQLKILKRLATPELLPPGLVQKIATYMDMSDYRIRLLHSSLLCFECSIVVVLNFVSWNFDAPEKKSEETGSGSNKTEPLLN